MIGKRFSVFKKGLLLIGAPILCQFVFIGFLLHAEAEEVYAERWAMHTKDVMAQAEMTYRIMLQAVSLFRGAVLSNDPNFGNNAGLSNRIEQEVGKLREAIVDNPRQVSRVAEYSRTSEALMQWIAGERQLIGEGRQAEALAEVRQRTGEAMIESLQDQLANILTEERSLDAVRIQRGDQARRQENWLITGAAVASLALAAGLLWAFARGIAARLAVVAENARRLVDRRPLQAAVGGSDEISEVDAAFHRAADQLADADAAEARHRAELELRAAELARANSELNLKTQENETFVYSVSHDLRSPLVNLQGFSRELAHSCDDLRRAAKGAPPEVRDRLDALIDGDITESVRFIQTAVTRSSGIIDALLRLSRAGRVEYKMVWVDTAAVVGRVIEAMQATLRGKGAEARVAGDLPRVWADATAVEQIFGNLIGNAANYLDPSRPGRIEVGVVEPASAEADSMGPALATYYVKDNGLGIPQAYLPKMFVAFQRLHGAVAPGEGIGLALIKRMVDRHGGTIRVESVEGVGSTFYVALPAREAAPVPRDAPPAV